MTKQKAEISFRQATETFISNAPWLGDADLPQLMAMRAIAAQLDDGTFQAALLSQYTLIHRTLLARGEKLPAGSPGIHPIGQGNPLELFLSDHEQQIINESFDDEN